MQSVKRPPSYRSSFERINSSTNSDQLNFCYAENRRKEIGLDINVSSLESTLMKETFEQRHPGYSNWQVRYYA